MKFFWDNIFLCVIVCPNNFFRLQLFANKFFRCLVSARLVGYKCLTAPWHFIQVLNIGSYTTHLFLLLLSFSLSIYTSSIYNVQQLRDRYIVQRCPPFLLTAFNTENVKHTTKLFPQTCLVPLWCVPINHHARFFFEMISSFFYILKLSQWATPLRTTLQLSNLQHLNELLATLFYPLLFMWLAHTSSGSITIQPSMPVYISQNNWIFYLVITTNRSTDLHIQITWLCV